MSHIAVACPWWSHVGSHKLTSMENGSCILITSDLLVPPHVPQLTDSAVPTKTRSHSRCLVSLAAFEASPAVNEGGGLPSEFSDFSAPISSAVESRELPLGSMKTCGVWKLPRRFFFEKCSSVYFSAPTHFPFPCVPSSLIPSCPVCSPPPILPCRYRI